MLQGWPRTLLSPSLSLLFLPSRLRQGVDVPERGGESIEWASGGSMQSVGVARCESKGVARREKRGRFGGGEQASASPLLGGGRRRRRRAAAATDTTPRRPHRRDRSTLSIPFDDSSNLLFSIRASSEPLRRQPRQLRARAGVHTVSLPQAAASAANRRPRTRPALAPLDPAGPCNARRDPPAVALASDGVLTRAPLLPRANGAAERKRGTSAPLSLLLRARPSARSPMSPGAPLPIAIWAAPGHPPARHGPSRARRAPRRTQTPLAFPISSHHKKKTLSPPPQLSITTAEANREPRAQHTHTQ